MIVRNVHMHYISHCMLGSFVERRILLPAPEPLSPVRSQGPKVVQTGPKLPLKRNPNGAKLPLRVVQTGRKCLSWIRRHLRCWSWKVGRDQKRQLDICCQLRSRLYEDSDKNVKPMMKKETRWPWRHLLAEKYWASPLVSNNPLCCARADAEQTSLWVVSITIAIASAIFSNSQRPALHIIPGIPNLLF